MLSLNDPFEHSLKIGEHEYALDERESTDDVKFVSLSRNYANLLMWSHYAASHTGFCIGFSRDNAYFSSAESVRYRRLRSNLNGVNVNSIVPGSIARKIALEKAIDWAYEEEERLFSDDVDTESLEVGVDNWGRKITLNSYPANSLTKIYVGLRASDSLVRELVFALRINGLDAEMYRAKRSLNEFGLSFGLLDKSTY
ncbi:DUF2971 domain-containing protein [Pseudomonas viridiflava]|uniref:DUF2971 domain-containing protein n=2 Tax=Pseudomonas viridiflava TaxID=33069 RepID=UPI0013DCDEB1|nr:DUF2971 domain-containing protein [Pseudomonas viridiflava]